MMLELIMLIESVPDPVFYIFAGFIGWLAKVLWDIWVKKNTPTEHNAKAYDRYKEVFSDEFISLIKSHNFAEPWEVKIWRDPMGYPWNCDNSDFKFHDKRLEKKRQSVIEAIKNFPKECEADTFVVRDNSSLYCIEKREEKIDPGQNKRLAILHELHEWCKETYPKLEAMKEACNRYFDKPIKKEVK